MRSPRHFASASLSGITTTLTRTAAGRVLYASLPNLLVFKRRFGPRPVPFQAQPSRAPYALPVELEPHRADLLGLWADALDAKDLTAAERDEFDPAIWRARAIAEDPSAYEDSDFFALVKEFERADGRWRSASGPDPPGPTAAAPES
jgi:hypothetical protein